MTMGEQHGGGTRAGTALSFEEEEVASQPPWPVRFARSALAGVTGVYLVALVAVFAATEWASDHWFAAALLFLPPQAWLLPLLVLIPLSLFIKPSLLWAHFAVVLLVFVGLMHWGAPAVPTARVRNLTVLSNNIGQRKIEKITPFLKKTDPDVVAFQEASNFARRHPNVVRTPYIAGIGEFFVGSKIPIRGSGVVPGLQHKGRAVAAWFELDYGGRSVIIYNVHMPTPRPYLLMLRGSGFRDSLMRASGIWSSDVRKEFADYWSARNALTENLLAVLKREQRPYIVVGDFNMPDRGCLFRKYKSRFDDAFARTGRGFGCTFPGNASQQLSFNAPWLRLDYLFSEEKSWRILSCEIEQGVDAEHLALAGKFELKR